MSSDISDFATIEKRLNQERLTRLILKNVKVFEAKKLAKLLISKNLTALTLKDCKIENEHMALFAREYLANSSSLADLAIIDIAINEEGIIAIANVLKVNSTLTSLKLNDNRIGDSEIEILADGLTTNTTLTTIDLSGNMIARGANKLAESLKNNTNITSLILSRNSICGAVTMMCKLQINSNLTTLVLARRLKELHRLRIHHQIGIVFSLCHYHIFYN
eukprot:TRINITY_DN18113_c0_g1_i1.p1 TRINITY_DN18113_c0_g1~~TRINITY_DN18113_c0_g1_i1.p1  ORF type:complete len:219 (+),score=14.83 TRINITY_DN18113_c0_g1_i1:112-768(+)